ncbi:MAG: hypothetical protein US30_C0007G0048 [Candidatus Moranbacteria bacterium GW2011_GWF2_36_839]|nr:MAG: hypothetical protein US27_C0007G0002 [Candidatus Moranbacteria bacterium GW2011_GWF1_36_78]KKQ17102.1 MAG: hypothetical protein US30_C0007G0048 [Candidatus Moranbacteria bacterium GW2011_GWF2_36_839]HAT73706.1 hypothetical protein [Candidatus Moranbacteria bacterium]HBY11319.1 hypothetical protein [Candidatus Moranbacteria bacterium]
MKKIFLKNKKGFTLIESLLAISVFSLLVMTFVGAMIYGQESERTAGERARATFLAEEGLEAVRNIRDANFATIVNSPTTYGLAVSGNVWTFSGTQDVMNGYFTRKITISDLSPVDFNAKRVISEVTWQQTPQRTGTITLSENISRWQSLHRGGMLVYGNGGTTVDTISYKILNPDTGVWSAQANAADVDGTSTNRALRSVKIFSSRIRNERIIISKHIDTGPNPDAQYIYAQVYNGATGTWGNVQLLSNWTNNSYTDVQNFDGTYLDNGDFMVTYSNNSTTPQFRIWNGSNWSGQMAMRVSGGIPNYIVAKNRPNTNEVMVAVFDQGSDTNTQYYDGSGYATTDWTAHTEHSALAPLATKRFVDFDWSQNSATRGALVYSDSSTDRALNIKIWAANGSGGGAWSATANTGNQGGTSTRLGAMAVQGRKGSDEFIACNNNTDNDILCYESNFTPTWSNPSNQTLETGTDTGIQRTFDIAFELLDGNEAIAVYSNASTTPRLKKYDPSGNSWDSSSTALSGLTSALETVRIIPNSDMNDAMILLGDTGTPQRVYSTVWDGTNNTTYSTPVSLTLINQSNNGSADENYWFDFAWDEFDFTNT